MNVRVKTTICLATLPWALGACPRIPSEPPAAQGVDAACVFDAIADTLAATGRYLKLPYGSPERGEAISDAIDDVIEDVRRCAGAVTEAGAGN